MSRGQIEKVLKSNIIYLFIVVMIVIYILEFRLRDKMKYEDQLNMFLSSLRSKEMFEIQNFTKLDVGKLNNTEARLAFFKMLSLPLQSFCRVLKRIGGHWDWRQVDGDKFICLDHILARDSGPCIIYSFGIANDWEFEDQMDSLGCQVFAYDHTITAPPRRGHNIQYFKTGLGLGGGSLKPLSQIIAENGHKNTVIEYLKIDIEGGEFSNGGFKDWLESGALENVNQLAIELHVHSEHTKRLQLVQDLYKMGYRVIAHEPNMVIGPFPDDFYHLVEVVFMREE